MERFQCPAPGARINPWIEPMKKVTCIDHQGTLFLIDLLDVQHIQMGKQEVLVQMRTGQTFRMRSDSAWFMALLFDLERECMLEGCRHLMEKLWNGEPVIWQAPGPALEA